MPTKTELPDGSVILEFENAEKADGPYKLLRSMTRGEKGAFPLWGRIRFDGYIARRIKTLITSA